MKIIKLYINENLAGEGGASTDEDLVPALETISRAIKGVPGVRIEITEGTIDDLVNDFRSKFERVYIVDGEYLIGNTPASISVQIDAVSEEEAIQKAKELGIINAHIKDSDYDCYDDDDDSYDEDDYYDEGEEEEY